MHVTKLVSESAHQSYFAWLLILVQLAGMSLSIFYARTSLSFMLSLSLSNMGFSGASSFIVDTIAMIGEVSGPLFSSLVYRWSLAHGFNYPFDTTFCFSTIALLCFLLYILSLAVHVKIERDSSSLAYKDRTMSRCDAVASVINIPVQDINDLIETAQENQGKYVV